jgi:hypothetical protein
MEAACALRVTAFPKPFWDVPLMSNEDLMKPGQ